MRRFGQSSYSYSAFWHINIEPSARDSPPCWVAKAAEEAMRLVAEKKRGEIKYANAARDIANFVDNADLMDQRKKDYQMSAEFEGASRVTKIQVGRNWSKTVVVGVIGIVLVLTLLYVLTRLI